MKLKYIYFGFFDWLSSSKNNNALDFCKKKGCGSPTWDKYGQLLIKGLYVQYIALGNTTYGSNIQAIVLTEESTLSSEEEASIRREVAAVACEDAYSISEGDTLFYASVEEEGAFLTEGSVKNEEESVYVACDMDKMKISFEDTLFEEDSPCRLFKELDEAQDFIKNFLNDGSSKRATERYWYGKSMYLLNKIIDEHQLELDKYEREDCLFAIMHALEEGLDCDWNTIKSIVGVEEEPSVPAKVPIKLITRDEWGKKSFEGCFCGGCDFAITFNEPTDFERENYRFCSRCGKPLDWSDTEEITRFN